MYCFLYFMYTGFIIYLFNYIMLILISEYLTVLNNIIYYSNDLEILKEFDFNLHELQDIMKYQYKTKGRDLHADGVGGLWKFYI